MQKFCKHFAKVANFAADLAAAFQEAEGARAVLVQVLEELAVLAGVHERRLALGPLAGGEAERQPGAQDPGADEGVDLCFF